MKHWLRLLIVLLPLCCVAQSSSRRGAMMRAVAAAAPAGGGAVGVESVTAATEVTGTTTPTLAATTASGANGVLHVLVTSETLGQTVTGVERNSEAFTKLGGATNATQWLQIWELKNPSSGSHTTTVTLDNSFRVQICAINYTNVNQTTPRGTEVKATGNGTSHSHNVTTASANELIADYYNWGATTMSFDDSQVSRVNYANSWNTAIGTLAGTGAAQAVGASISSGARDYSHWSVNLKAAAGYTYTATLFDGANDWLSYSGDMTGEADGKLLTVSFWLKVSGGDGTTRYIWRDGGDLVAINLDTDNKISFFAQDSTFTTTGRFLTSSTFPAGSTWYHIILSWDLTDSGKRHVYVDGSADGGTWLNYNNQNTDYANGGDHGICATAAGASKAQVSLCEFYLHEAAYIDLSVQSNREKFRSGAGKPVNLGSNGSTPTGSTPIVYLKTQSPSFESNSGSGGNFTENGATADDASIP